MSATAVAGNAHAAPAPARFLDRGAIFAGWVGIGMALVIAIAFELIIAIQTLVFVVAIPAGMLIGGYANARSQRWRPMRRVFANAAYAGLVTGLSLAVMYGMLRLLFVFADTGYPAFNRVDASGNPVGIQCATGPDCTYQRYLADGRGQDLAAAAVTDGGSFGAYALREQLNGGTIIVVLTLGGSLVAAGWRSVRTPRAADVSLAA
jgi:hypothetical protein